MKSNVLDTCPPWEEDPQLIAYPQVKKWFEEAETDLVAAFHIGVIYHRHIKNPEKAAAYYKRACELGSLDAAFQLGILYEEQKYLNLALHWYETAAAEEHEIAAYNLGVIYKEEFHDYDTALQWSLKAYDLGYTTAALVIGMIYTKLGNLTQALHWNETAAREGMPEAIKNTGILHYKNGDAVRGAAYLMALVRSGEPEANVFGFLKDHWKLDRQTLRKAYALQKSLDIPKHNEGDIEKHLREFPAEDEKDVWWGDDARLKEYP
jgi:TPR repeat protein